MLKMIEQNQGNRKIAQSYCNQKSQDLRKLILFQIYTV